MRANSVLREKVSLNHVSPKSCLAVQKKLKNGEVATMQDCKALFFWRWGDRLIKKYMLFREIGIAYFRIYSILNLECLNGKDVGHPKRAAHHRSRSLIRTGKALLLEMSGEAPVPKCDLN